MPGGTLHERVKDGGAMPVAEAVDAILQIIAGLEAAHAVGILHRDIKPSNCFIEPSGTVKVGDFGLSISTLSRGDSALTLAGSILGTPEFSSPEQLRGEELNVRSDIYSVGMTLYYLLTGKTAFQAQNVVQLLATVLDKAPQPPREIRPEIPEALSRIVLRCLAKQAAERPSSYDELRRALLPFTSTAPTPATLGLRCVAGVIDKIAFMIVNMTVPMLFLGGPEVFMQTNAAAVQTPVWRWYVIALLAFQIAYFAVPEGRWGASPGKALVGLRVGGLDRNAPGLLRALLRSLIYLVPSTINTLYFLTGAATESMAWNFAFGATLWLYPALLCVTARRSNGFATVIDLLTKTRVIQKSAYEPREMIAQIEEPVATTDAMPKVGPYHVLAPLIADDDGELLLGYDTKLMRRVWIRKMPVDAAPVAVELRNAARPGRLRWLQGQRDGTESWDAYEAAPGTPLAALLHTPQPWKNVRHWLLDLSTEFAAATADGSMPAQLSLDRVWITASGGAKLLDFRAPGADAAHEPISRDDAPIFLNQLAISALEGRAATAEEARTSEPRLPVAVPARGLLHVLRTAGDFTALTAQLRALAQQLPAITRRRRLGLIAGCVIPSLIMGGLLFMGVMIINSWKQKNPDVRLLRVALAIHERMQEGKYPRGVDPAIGLEPVETYIAGRFGRVVNDSSVWSSPYIGGLIVPHDRKTAERIVAQIGQPSDEAMAKARAALRGAIDKNGELDNRSPAEKEDKQFQSILGQMIFFGGFFWAAFLSIAAAVLCRGGLLMRALGIAVVTRDGSDASRWRMLWRACVAWSWLPLAAVLVAMLAPVLSVNTAVWLIANILPGIVVWSALTRRSLPDRLAGTWLVPR